MANRRWWRRRGRSRTLRRRPWSGPPGCRRSASSIRVMNHRRHDRRWLLDRSRGGWHRRRLGSGRGRRFARKVIGGQVREQPGQAKRAHHAAERDRATDEDRPITCGRLGVPFHRPRSVAPGRGGRWRGTKGRARAGGWPGRARCRRLGRWIWRSSRRWRVVDVDRPVHRRNGRKDRAGLDRRRRRRRV